MAVMCLEQELQMGLPVKDEYQDPGRLLCEQLTEAISLVILPWEHSNS
jgi:hypothetical protein